MAIDFREVETLNNGTLLSQASSEQAPSYIKKVAQGLTESFKKRSSSLIDTGKDFLTGKIGAPEAKIQVAGAAFGGVNDLIGSVTAPVVEPLVQKAVSSSVGQNILSNPDVQKGLQIASQGADLYKKWKTENPNLAKDLESIVNIASFLPTGKGAQLGAEAIGTATKTVARGASAIADVVEPAATVGKNVIQATGDVLGGVAKTVQRLPERTAINTATRQAEKQSIKALGSPTLKNAVADGVDIADLTFTKNLSQSEKAATKKMYETAVKFAADKGTKNPQELVGQTVRARIKSADTIRKKIGQQLGEAANNLGDVSQETLQPKILESLQRVSGFENIALTPKGNLNFKGTVLASSLSSSERKTLNKLFKDAIKSGTGKSKHFLRQEIFEDLGGKAKAGIKLTESNQKAAEAIRSGLADVLEGQNKLYKKLSAKYRSVIKPLKDLQGMIKADGAPEDIFNLKAAIIGRRVTSNAPSGQDVRAYLRALDEVITKNGGKVPVSTEKMQQAYNIFNRYLDIAPETGLQGQVQAAIGNKLPGSKTELLMKAIESTTGKTPEVRQEAFDKAMREILGLSIDSKVKTKK